MVGCLYKHCVVGGGFLYYIICNFVLKINKSPPSLLLSLAVYIPNSYSQYLLLSAGSASFLPSFLPLGFLYLTFLHLETLELVPLLGLSDSRDGEVEPPPGARRGGERDGQGPGRLGDAAVRNARSAQRRRHGSRWRQPWRPHDQNQSLLRLLPPRDFPPF